MSDVEFERRVAARASRTGRGPSGSSRDASWTRARCRRADGQAVGAATPMRPRWPARHSIVGLAMAASIGSIAMLGRLRSARRARRERGAVGVIGDSVVATLRDTLRLVRLIFDDPGARRVAVVGDFNGWAASATPLYRDDPHRRAGPSSSHCAMATIAMRSSSTARDGSPIRRTTPCAIADRLVSLLHVARASN